MVAIELNPDNPMTSTVEMKTSDSENAFAFIVGSPRSGTTILGEILDGHERIAQWYEPYFVWDHHFRDRPHDRRSEDEATPRVIRQIRGDFIRYQRKTGASLIVDKSPRNSLKIPFIRKIFPEARFVHILRDGRDVTLSIHKEWLRRTQIVADPYQGRRFNHRKAARVINRWLGRQPFWGDKIRALWFETHGHLVDKSQHLNRLRWRGSVGWGPRFADWEAILKNGSLLQFNAYQWLKCVEAIQADWDQIPPEKRLEIRYEQMVDNGPQTIAAIVQFLGLEASEAFLASIPALKAGNYNKWPQAFTSDQQADIGTILNPMLQKLGY